MLRLLAPVKAPVKVCTDSPSTLPSPSQSARSEPTTDTDTAGGLLLSAPGDREAYQRFAARADAASALAWLARPLFEIELPKQPPCHAALPGIAATLAVAGPPRPCPACTCGGVGTTLLEPARGGKARRQSSPS